MKKLFVLVFAIALCLGVLCFGASADNSGTPKAPTGSGTADDPYQIGTAEELYWFAQYVKPSDPTSWYACAKLTENITINEDVLDAVAHGDTDDLNKWTPIYLYLGTFDGNGHTISGLYLSETDRNSGSQIGMFGVVRGTVKDLTLADSYVAGVFYIPGFNDTDDRVQSYIGGICGYISPGATVSGCPFNGVVSASTSEIYNLPYAGGICGGNEGLLEGCTFDGTLTAANNTDKNNAYIFSYAGGISGSNVGTIQDCTNNGTIKGEGKNPAAGGICGYGGFANNPQKQIGVIKDCTNMGEISSITDGGEGNSCYAGGILGDGSDNIEGCHNEGSVLGANYAGGIAGVISGGTITDCTNSATVEAYYQAAGGICAVTSSYLISGCTNSGEVKITDTSEGKATYLGGICGEVTSFGGNIVNCCNTGKLSGYQAYNDTMYIGGICGYFDYGYGQKPNAYIWNCCNTGERSYNFSGHVVTGEICGSLGDRGKTEHSFWLADASGGVDSGARTKEQFARGEVAYELNKWDNTEYGGKMWKVGDNGYPVLEGDNNEVLRVIFRKIIGNKIMATYGINKGGTLENTDTSWITGNMRLIFNFDIIPKEDLLKTPLNEDTEIIVQVVEDGKEKPITAIVTGSASKVYDGTTVVPAGHNLSIKLVGVVAGETVTATAESYTFDNKNAGEGKTITANGIALGGADAEKYVLVSDTVSAEVGTIEQKELTASLSGNLSKEYDSTADAPEGLSIMLNGAITGGDVTATAASYVYGDASAGGNKTITASGITLTGADAGNYTLSSTTVSSNVGEITPKTVTITADDQSAFMGDELPELSYKADGFIGNDKLTEEPILSCNADMTKAGTYEITVSGGAASDNYKLVYKNGTLTVKQSWIVTVKPGNGAADEISYIIPGGSFTIPDAPKNGGYIFLGWRCGDETYKAGETIEVTSDMTFTAVWGNLPDVDPEEPEPEPELPFYDVAKGDWFYDAVKYVYYADLMDGVEEHIFAPNYTLTRAMVWTIIARTEGVDTDGGATWYAKAQEWVAAMGISDGTEPNAPITREQLVTMLWRLAGEPALGSGINAPDAGSVSSWALQAMSWAMYIGLVEGDENGAVTPAATATRAQAAAIFMRYLEK